MKIKRIASIVMLAAFTAGCIYATKLPQNAIEKQLYNNNAKLFADFFVDNDALGLIETDKYDLFISGEYHAAAKNFKQQLLLVKYLHENAGVNYIVLEGGVCSTGYINMYLQTGNEEILKSAYAELKGTMAYINESYHFYQELYEYNAQLAETDRITLIGMDIEHQRENAPKYLQYLLPNEAAPANISANLELLREFTKYNQQQIAIDIMHAINEDITKYQAEYEKYFGERFFEFQLAVENYTDMETADLYRAKQQELKLRSFREQNTIDNFQRLFEHYKTGGKFYGEWGSFHATQTQLNDNDMRLAAELNKPSSPLAGKICSILNLYDNCEILPAHEAAQPIGRQMADGLLESFKKYSNGDVTLFKLVGENSPFEEADKLDPRKTALTDSFQYVMLIQDSQACTRYEEK